MQYQEVKRTNPASDDLKTEEISKSNPVVVTQRIAEMKLYLSHKKNEAKLCEPKIQNHNPQ